MQFDPLPIEENRLNTHPGSGNTFPTKRDSPRQALLLEHCQYYFIFSLWSNEKEFPILADQAYRSVLKFIGSTVRALKRRKRQITTVDRFIARTRKRGLFELADCSNGIKFEQWHLQLFSICEISTKSQTWKNKFCFKRKSGSWKMTAQQHLWLHIPWLNSIWVYFGALREMNSSLKKGSKTRAHITCASLHSKGQIMLLGLEFAESLRTHILRLKNSCDSGKAKLFLYFDINQNNNPPVLILFPTLISIVWNLKPGRNRNLDFSSRSNL